MPNPPPRSSSWIATPCSAWIRAASSSTRRAATSKPPVSKICDPMCECSPANSSTGQRQHPPDRLVGGAGREREAELLVVVGGGHELVGVRLDPGRDPDQDARPGAGDVRVVGQPGDLLERVDHDVPDPGRHRLLDLGGQLVVAVQRDQGRVHPGRERHRQLAAGAHVHPEPLVGHPAQHRPRAERLGRVGDVRVRAERLRVLAGPAADVRLVGDQHRGAEPGGQIAHVDAAERQHPALPLGAARPDRRVERVKVGGRRRRVVGRQHVPVPRPGRVGDTTHCGSPFSTSQLHSRSGAPTPRSPSPAARPVRAAFAMDSLSVPGTRAFAG